MSYVGLGVEYEVKNKDYVTVYTKQRADAKAQFGTTDIVDTGYARVKYPRMSAEFAARLVAYWVNEAKKISKYSGIKDSALENQRVAAWDKLNSLNQMASYFGWPGSSKLLSDKQAIQVWNDVLSAALHYRYYDESPSNWQDVKKLIRDIFNDLGEKGSDWLELATVAVATWGGFKLYEMWKSKKRTT